jgi:hypothetical protein
VENGQISERRALDDVASLARLAERSPGGRNARQRSFDAATYDRLRVLLTELHRVRDGGGEVAVRVGAHQLGGEALAALLRSL